MTDELNANELFEIRAAVFHTMTGHMAPGKDAPAAMNVGSYDKRIEAWERWQSMYGFAVTEAIHETKKLLWP